MGKMIYEGRDFIQAREAEAAMTWQLEHPTPAPGGQLPIEDGDRVVIDGRLFRVELIDTPAPQEPPIPAIRELSLHFGISRDEEYVELQVSCGSQQWSLGPRAHLYPLLLLARARLADLEVSSLPRSAHGWMYQDELVEMLDYSPNRLHTEIYRARRQFAALGVRDASRLIERRVSTRQLRIGVEGLEFEHI